MMTGEQIIAELGSFDGAAEILQAWRDGMAPEPALLVSDWADKHRMLGSLGSAEPGPWRTNRTPYLRDVMDALSPAHPARRVVFMKGAQVGGTECGNNWIGYVIHHAPGPMLAVQPTTELAKRFSDQRIDPLVEETPAIRQRVAPARSRDSGNRQLSKEFPGGQLVMTGANSAVGLRSMSARFLFLDEVDAYPGDVEGEGDPVALAEARARTFGWRRKTLLVSTPTISGLSRIEREYLASDQRRFFVPCPHCATMQWLRFERLVWEKGEPDSARYLCEACDGAIGEQHKTAMLDRLMAAFDPEEGRAIVQPTFRGKQGNPMLWPREFIPAMMAVSGDFGARHLAGLHADRLVEVEMPDDAVLRDFDTTDALKGAPGFTAAAGSRTG